MTEREWLESTDPNGILKFLRDKVSNRKLRLFAVACCRRLKTPENDSNHEYVLRVAEKWADEVATDTELQQARERLRSTYFQLLDDDGFRSTEVAHFLVYLRKSDAREAQLTPEARQILEFMDYQPDLTSPPCFAAAQEEEVAQVAVLHEIFGPTHFRPFILDSSWLAWNNGTVVKIAQATYDDRAFDRLPILADALEDAGCTDADILDHLRSDGPHVRGCWALDRILARN